MSLFQSGSGKPVSPDFNKLLEGGAGAVAGGAPVTFTPAAAVDGLQITHCGSDKNIALLVTATADAASGYTIAGDMTQVIAAGASHSISLDDIPADGNAILEFTITAVDLSGIAASTTVTLGSALTAAAATAIVPYIVNVIES